MFILKYFGKNNNAYKHTSPMLTFKQTNATNKLETWTSAWIAKELTSIRFKYMVNKKIQLVLARHI